MPKERGLLVSFDILFVSVATGSLFLDDSLIVDSFHACFDGF